MKGGGGDGAEGWQVRAFIIWEVAGSAFGSEPRKRITVGGV